MNNKNKRKYEKAIRYCEKGKLEKAFNICEESIADDLSASEFLNLKGLLLYEKGLLKEASTVWKLNSVVNNNLESKSYVKGCENDKDKLRQYEEACRYIKDGNYDKALAILTKCTKSDFNCINVNTKIAYCYEKKAFYYKAMEYVEKALKVDSDFEEAIMLKNELLIRFKEEYNQDYTSESKNKLVVATLFVAVLAIIVGTYSIKNKINLNKADSEQNTQVEQVVENDDVINVEEDSNKEEEDKSHEEVGVKKEETPVKTDFNNVNELMNNKEFDKLYDALESVKTETLNDKDKQIYNSAIELIKNEGVEEFYKEGSSYYNDKNYSKARNELDKAYKYCEGNYLKPHIIFYRGTVASEQGQKDVMESMYEEYIKEDPKGSYIEGVLYELSLLNEKNGNDDKAKKYAEDLEYNYPESIYINSKLTEILYK